MQHIAELGAILKQVDIKELVICPGSRNAPLMELFTSDSFFTCHSIVDERSAAYVALGMARQKGQTVGVVTTSGTAVLNLAPAVAEAWKQRIPLLVITADRPEEAIDRFNNQRIDQYRPFEGNSKAFLQLPPTFTSPEEMADSMKELAAFLSRLGEKPYGPLHLNLCLEEPLYEDLPPALLEMKLPPPRKPDRALPFLPAYGDRVLVLAGAGMHGERAGALLEELGRKLQLAVVAENLANMPQPGFINNPEPLLASCTDEERKALVPDHVISFGGQLVSKRLKIMVQGVEDLVHVDAGEEPAVFLEELLGMCGSPGERENTYAGSWKKAEARMLPLLEKKLDALPFGNILVIKKALERVAPGTVVHLGNSSTIRYSQLLPLRNDLEYFSNRGTSGIDGCVSTAVGAAMVSDRPHLLLVGDLSFVYDSNALWNRNYPGNLKIVVINDGGGGIFRLLEGPSRKDFYEEFSVSGHPVSPALLAESFGRGSRTLGHEQDPGPFLDELLGEGAGLQVLDVHTMNSENSRIFKTLLDFKSED